MNPFLDQSTDAELKLSLSGEFLVAGGPFFVAQLLERHLLVNPLPTCKTIGCCGRRQDLGLSPSTTPCCKANQLFRSSVAKL